MIKLENLQKFKLFWYLKKKLKLKSPDKISFEKSNFNRISLFTNFEISKDSAKYLEIGVFKMLF